MDWHQKQKWAADLRRAARHAPIPKPPPAVKPAPQRLMENLAAIDLWSLPKEEANLKKPFSGARNYGAWLMAKGWERLGSGAHSIVYAKLDSDKVIKVTSSLDNWIDYVQWAAKAGYAGNLAPRVFSWKRHQIENGHAFAVAVVERMSHGGYNEDPRHDGALLFGLTRYARKGNIIAQCVMEDIQPGSVSFFKQLSELNYDGDIGGNNIMYRKDGSLCLTDPCAGRIETTVKRLRSGDLSPSLYGYLVESCYRHRGQWIAQPYQDLVGCLQRH